MYRATGYVLSYSFRLALFGWSAA